jgi:hypothetical protein
MLRSSGLVRRQRRGGGNPPAPSVTLAVGDAASNTLKFTLTLSDADKCTYVCTKSSEAVPSAEKILADGKSVTASGLITIGDLEPSTTYLGSRLQRQGQRQGRNHRTHHLRPRRTPGRRSDARHAHFDDPFVHRGPDRPRNGRIRLSRKDRRDDRSHGRRDSPRRHRHRPDG